MIGLAAPASADGSDDQFIAALHAAGITFQDPAKVVGAGKWVCQTAGHGGQMVDIVATVQQLNPGLNQENAAKFAAIAASAYCPKALGSATVNAGAGS